MAKVIIVNEQNEIIGTKNRRDLTPQDIYRVSSLRITNSQGDILLAQRAHDKDHDPGKWGPAVAGTLEEGETYESNIIKEAGEEIGLFNIHPTPGPIERSTGKYNYFRQRFFLTLDKPIEEFSPDRTEVAAVKWFSRAELAEAVTTHPEMFLKSIQDLVKNNFV